MVCVCLCVCVYVCVYISVCMYVSWCMHHACMRACISIHTNTHTHIHTYTHTHIHTYTHNHWMMHHKTTGPFSRQARPNIHRLIRHIQLDDRIPHTRFSSPPPILLVRYARHRLAAVARTVYTRRPSCYVLWLRGGREPADGCTGSYGGKSCVFTGRGEAAQCCVWATHLSDEQMKASFCVRVTVTVTDYLFRLSELLVLGSRSRSRSQTIHLDDQN